MARFLTERNFTEEIELTKGDADNIRRVNEDEGAVLVPQPGQAEDLLPLRDAKRRGIRAAVCRLDIPADVIVEVWDLRSEMFA